MNNQNQNGQSRPQSRPARPAGNGARRPVNPGARPRPVNPGAQGRPANADRGQGYYQPRDAKRPAPKRKSKKHRSLGTTVAIVVVAAAICVLLTFLVLFLLGFRYMSYKVNRADEQITVKYIGRVDSEGNPYDGTVIYPDKTGKLARDSANANWYTIAYSNGDVYRGYLKKALKHGMGVVVYSNGDKYDGNFANDVIDTTNIEDTDCIYTYANGDTYVGGFKDGMKHGVGKMTFADGDDDPDNNPYYEGAFEANLRQGEGKELYTDGSVYEGSFWGDLRHGEGTFTFSNGDKYQGDFVDGVRTGKGVYTWANGDTYTGDFVEGDMNGTGTYTLASGKSYKGKFENGQIVIGEGNIIDLTPDD